MDTSVNNELIKLYEQIGRLQDEIANLTKEVYLMSVVHYDEVDGTPENLSEFNNDMNYASMGEVDEKIKSIPPTDDSNYLKKSGEEELKCDIPTIFKHLYTITLKRDDNSDNVATTKFVHQLVKESSKATELHLSGVYQKYKPLTLAQVKGEIDNALVIYDTASIINEKIAAAIRGISIPSRTSELQNDSGYITLADVPPSPVLSVNGLTGEVIIQIPTVPTNISAFTNDVGYITDAGVTSVNNQTGNVYVQENVQSDWSAVSGNSAILNKPALKRVATTGSYDDLDDTPNLATVAMSGDYNDLSNRIVAAQLVGRLHRTNVSGSGNITVNGTSGQFPTITAPGTYTLHTYMRSATLSYSLRVTFGTASYTLTTTNGEINDVREYTISGTTTWGASIPSGSVAANTELDVKIIKASAEYVSTIGYAAVSNDYNDLDNTPTLATVATSGSYNDLSDAPTIPTVPTNVSAFTNDAGYLTTHLDISGKQDVLTAGDGIAIDNTDTIRTTGIPYGECDSTSTATAFTATVPGIYKLEDGVCCIVKNGIVTSASGFTLNINGLGAKPSYNNMATGNDITPTAPTRDTTIFNINYSMLFIYSETIVNGGGWICYRGYDANTNTIGYQVRTNSSTLKAKSKFYRYRLLFTSADHDYWIPANTSTSTNATASRTVNQDKIDPFGPIVYYGTTTAVEANASVTAAQLWQEYTLTLGYSFNRTGAALTLSYPKYVYVKCTPQTDGSAIIDPDNPIVLTLPSTEDGKIYILLGRAYSAIAIELLLDHPVYYYKDGAVRHWTLDSVELASLKSRVAALEAIVNPT